MRLEHISLDICKVRRGYLTYHIVTFETADPSFAVYKFTVSGHQMGVYEEVIVHFRAYRTQSDIYKSMSVRKYFGNLLLY